MSDVDDVQEAPAADQLKKRDSSPEELKPEPIILGPILSAAEGDTKADIRNKVWKYLESNNLATFPRPVRNRIPNYKGSAAACDKACDLEVFKNAQTIKINPDKPQEQARFRTLETETKTLLVPTPRLRSGLFNKITPPNTTKSSLRFCSTSQGVRQHSTALELDMKLKVDLVIVGSVAVSKSGFRIGKGEGFADMEYGMMASIGAVDENTIVITTVHECQLMELPEELFGDHDITVDYICTPHRVIECSRRPKPTGIIWSILGLEKFRQIPILKVLRDQESLAGKNVSLREEITEEEIDTAIQEVKEEDERRQKEREEQGPRPRDRRYRRDRRDRRRDTEEGEMVNGGEHADGEVSPSGEPRRRPYNNRRRRIRNRPRGDRPYNEGDNAPVGDEEHHEGDGNQRRRRPRRPRGPRQDSKGEPISGDDHDHDGGRSPEPRPDARRRQRRNRRPRRSEGDRGEEYGDSGPQEGDDQDRRRPRRFSNRRRRPDRRDDQDGSPSRDDADSPQDGRRRFRRTNNLPSVYIGSLPKALRVSDFKKQVRDKDVNPLRVLWRGTNGHSFIMFQTLEETEDALRKLENLSINEKPVKVALANRTERKLKEESPEPEVHAASGGGDTQS